MEWKNQWYVPKNEYRDYAYEKEVIERFQARAPKRVFDAHFHLSFDEIAGVPEDQVFAEWKRRTEATIGEGCIQGGLLMGNPSNYPSKEYLDADRRFSCETAEANPGFVAGLLCKPDDDPAEIEEWLARYSSIAALKPYRAYARAKDTYEADILDYAPEWMWEMANDHEMSVVVHLSHYGEMLRDPRNGEQIRYISRTYPKSKIILAHCAMGHHPDKFKCGLPYLEGLDNVWLDCSGVSEALTIIYALKALGSDRIMYGSDGYNFGQMLGRVMSLGGNFVGLHDLEGLTLPPDYRYQPLNNMCEGLLALYAAGDICQLSEKQWDDIFYNNAAGVYLSGRK